MKQKIAITIDPDVFERIESLRERTRESRSAVFDRAARLLLARSEHRMRVETYVECYRLSPEEPADEALAADLARRALAAVPWEDEA